MTPEDIEQKLNEVGPGMCLAKWYHVSMHLHTGRNHSCYHPPTHVVPLEELKNSLHALHNSNYKKEQRREMLEGGRPSECGYCWAIEDTGNISDRVYRSSEPWSSVKLLEDTARLDFNTDVYPKYLEVNFGYQCQLKCSYCTPAVSSAWHNEIRREGLYSLTDPRNRYQYGIGDIKPGEFWTREEDNPYVEAFWHWFPDAYPHLRTLRVTGGEPLLSRSVFKLIDYIEAHPHSDLTFAVNSNMMVTPEQINRFVESSGRLTIKHLQLFTSIDSWGEQADYIRNGLDYTVWQNNVSDFMNRVPHATLHLMITVNFLSLWRLHELFGWIGEARKLWPGRVFFDTPHLVEPRHLSLQIAEPEQLDLFLNSMTIMLLGDFTSQEMDKLSRVIDWAEANRFQDHELLTHRADFVRFVEQHDQRRGTDFAKTFPELTETVDTWRQP